MTDQKEQAQEDGVCSKSQDSSWLKSRWPEVAFFTGLTCLSMIFGFGATLASSKKADPKYFDKGLVAEPVVSPANKARLHESGASLAARALGRATLYSVGGFTVFWIMVWKLSGARNFEEFRHKMGHVLPKVSRNNPPTSRTEFENLTELFQYVIDEDNKEKKPRHEALITSAGEANAHD